MDDAGWYVKGLAVWNPMRPTMLKPLLITVWATATGSVAFGQTG